MSRVFVIAEAGVNHNGDLTTALKLTDAAATAGADAVKFQTFNTDELVTDSAPLAPYQKTGDSGADTQREMLRKLQLSEDAHFGLRDHARQAGLAFISTPFDLASLEFLAGPLGLKTIKISSGDLTNLPLLYDAAIRGCDMILSTGMATMEEIALAVRTAESGYQAGSPPNIRPDTPTDPPAVASPQAAAKITLLQCTTQYPASADELHLKVISKLRETFGVRTGFSDHSDGIHAAIAAVAVGAEVVEKHFTLNRGDTGPDHKASLEPSALAELIAAIRSVERAMGSSQKGPTPSEVENMPVARKSLVASAPIKSGQQFTAQNVTVKRPGTGLSPIHYWYLLGRPADRNYQANDLIDAAAIL